MEKKVLNEIIDIIRCVVPIENELLQDSKIDEWGLDSISFVEIIVGIEGKFDIEFDTEDLAENRFFTLNDLEQRVLELLNK